MSFRLAIVSKVAPPFLPADGSLPLSVTGGAAVAHGRQGGGRFRSLEKKTRQAYRRGSGC